MTSFQKLEFSAADVIQSIKDGNVIGRGHNRREADHSALAHAEVEAIRQACDTMAGLRRLMPSSSAILM